MKLHKLTALLMVAFAASLCQGKTEVGELDGAPFRIDLPENWNHRLVMYCHGYSTDPPKYDAGKPLDEVQATFVNAGYAFAQSAYSRTGWAIEQAVPETEALRKYFIKKYGQPEGTYITGHSMGGLLTTILIEKYPESYDAGLPMCGALGSSLALMGAGFDTRVLFDYYFPGLLPSPAKVPADYQPSEGLTKKIERALRAKPASAAAFRRYAGSARNPDIASGMVFLTFVLKDIQERSGGNPFDNRNTIYAGMPNAGAVNDGVKRYSADPGALDYLKRFYTPSGHITRPMLAIHTTYDPVVAPRVPAGYSLLTRAAGNGELFVQQYVKHDGHCNILPAEVKRGFDELLEWKQSGKRPAPGKLE